MEDLGGPQKFTPIKINELSGLWNYLTSIDWSEPWFTGLGMFHIFCALLTIMSRRTGIFQAVYFGILVLLVLCAEQINTWAAANWKLFARQQYFDSNGLFISVVFSVPCLINCLVMVVCWLFDVGVLISEVKQMKYRKRRSSPTASGQANVEDNGEKTEGGTEGKTDRTEEGKKDQ